MTEIHSAIVAEGRSEVVIDRSRFLGYAVPAQTPAAAETALQALRGAHPDATHHCYAWRIGPGQERQSDDGEPQGTAGLPLLETLRRRGIDYGLLVVVRYYGGRKLGRPGLFRAYLGAGADALDAARVERMTPGTRYRASVAHAQRVSLLRAIEAADGEVLAVEFAARVQVEFWLPAGAGLSELVRRCDAAGQAEELGPAVRGRSPG